MTPATLTAEALAEKLAQYLAEENVRGTEWEAEFNWSLATDPMFRRSFIDRAKHLLAGPLAPLLAAEASLQRVTAERDKYAEALMQVAEVGGWQASAGLAEEVRAAIKIATAEAARLRERLEIAHAYDGAGNKIPFPEGMEHLDGIECRDETIRNLEEQAARLRGEVEAKDRALKLLLPFVDYAAGEGLMFLGSDDTERPEMDAAEICCAVAEALGLELGDPEYLALVEQGQTAIAARAATEKGQADG